MAVIRVLEAISAGFGVVWQRGETQDVSDDLARLLVTQRRAEYVSPPAAPADWLVPVMKKVDEAADQSSVSGGGTGITLAANRFSRPLSVVGFGNSIVAWKSPFWGYALTSASGGRLRLTGLNAGVPGNTTAQMLARVDSDPNLIGADVAVVQECTNDGSQNVTVAQHVSNMRQILAKLLARGILPVISLPPAWGAADNQKIFRLGIADYFLAQELGLPVYQPWAWTYHPTTGLPLAGTTVSGTDFHPVSGSHSIAAARLAAQIAGDSSVSLLPVTNGVTWGLNTDPLLLTNNGASPTGAGWSASASGGTLSIVPGTGDVVGNWARVTGGGTGFARVEFQGAVSAGDTVRVVFRCKTSGLQTESMRIYAHALPSYSICTDMGYDVQTTMDGVIDHTFVVPAATTGIKFYFGLNSTPAETGYLQIAQVQLYRVNTALT